MRSERIKCYLDHDVGALVDVGGCHDWWIVMVSGRVIFWVFDLISSYLLLSVQIRTNFVSECTRAELERLCRQKKNTDNNERARTLARSLRAFVPHTQGPRHTRRSLVC